MEHDLRNGLKWSLQWISVGRPCFYKPLNQAEIGSGSTETFQFLRTLLIRVHNASEVPFTLPIPSLCAATHRCEVWWGKHRHTRDGGGYVIGADFITINTCQMATTHFLWLNCQRQNHIRTMIFYPRGKKGKKRQSNETHLHIVSTGRQLLT